MVAPKKIIFLPAEETSSHVVSLNRTRFAHRNKVHYTRKAKIPLIDCKVRKVDKGTKLVDNFEYNSVQMKESSPIDRKDRKNNS